LRDDILFQLTAPIGFNDELLEFRLLLLEVVASLVGELLIQVVSGPGDFVE